jgi:hypothetical protein
VTTSNDADQLIRGGFVRVDPLTSAAHVLVFPSNPATLSRALVSTPNAEGAGEPREQISFVLMLEAIPGRTDQLGIYPLLSALELLLYLPSAPPPVLLFVWGSRRILPVRVIELHVKEQLFDDALTPTQAELAVTLQVLKKADLAAGTFGREQWEAHLAIMQQLASALPVAALADLGLGGLDLGAGA